MKKTTILSLIVLATITFFQSCAPIYQQAPVPLKDAQDQGRVRVVTTINNTIYFKNIRKTGAGYIGTNSKNIDFPFDSSQIKYVYLEDIGVMGKNIFSGEFLGNFYAGFGVKYERIIPLTKSIEIIPKVGVGMNIMMGFGPPVAFAGASVAFGDRRNKIAIGANYLAVHNLPLLDLEYRYHGRGGFFFSGGLYYSLEEYDNYFIPSIAIGKKF